MHNHHADLNILHASLQNCINKLINKLSTEMNHMVLHPDKTKFTPITTRQKRQNIVSYPSPPPPPPLHPYPSLTIKGTIIQEVRNHRVLGVIIDNNLAWTPHVNTLCKKISIKVFHLSKIKHFVNFHARKIFFSAIYSVDN